MVKHLLWLLVGAAYPVSAMEHQQTPSNCQDIRVECAAVVTTAVDKLGQLWRAYSIGQTLYLEHTSASDSAFSSPLAVNRIGEPISNRGENRPKLALDAQQGIYLSWAMDREERFTADVRLSYSLDGGKHFTAPATINDDGLLAGHSFNEMLVSPEGKVSLVWLDSRAKATAGAADVAVGSAIYHASGTPHLGKQDFTNDKLVTGTCQCCRLAYAESTDGSQTLMWRHIYPGSLREFALMSLSDRKVHQISHDEWQLDGCPHQGGGLAIDKRDRFHMVWFNAGNKGKGIFYAHSDDRGNTLSVPLAVGDSQRLASHPYVGVSGERVDLVWNEFDGQEFVLMHQASTDSGISFGPVRELARATQADRPFILQRHHQPWISWHRPGQGHLLERLP